MQIAREHIAQNTQSGHIARYIDLMDRAVCKDCGGRQATSCGTTFDARLTARKALGGRPSSRLNARLNDASDS